MSRAVQSYVEGRWQDGTGEQRPLLDAATGEVVATIPAAGPDPAAALAYARGVGGPATSAAAASRALRCSSPSMPITQPPARKGRGRISARHRGRGRGLDVPVKRLCGA